MIHFIKYNNFTVFIVLAVFIIGSGVFAQTETGQALIGGEKTSVTGTDNSVLLATDLDNFNFDYKIEKIEQDEKYYYVTYTFLDIVNISNAWQFQLQQNIRKVSRKLKEDLGLYLASEFKEEAEKKLSDLKEVKTKAEASGPESRVEVTEYSGLIGQTLDLVAKVFPNYDPVKKINLPTPESSFVLPQTEQATAPSSADNLTSMYDEYMAAHDQDGDKYLDALDNCPAVSNLDQADADMNGVGDACQTEDTASTTPISESPAAESDPIIPEETAPASDGSVIPEQDNVTPEITETVTTEPEQVEIIDLNSTPEEPAQEVIP